MQWLTELTGDQLEQLRARFDRCTCLADCLAIIEQRGATLRHCQHCQGDKLYCHGVFYGLQRYRCRQCTRAFNALTRCHELDGGRIATPQQFLRAALCPAGT